jgi:hypothetical protein
MIDDQEILAMGTIAEALKPLDEATRKRVIEWLISREGIGGTVGTRIGPVLPVTNAAGSVLSGESNTQSLSDFFYSVDPQNDMERALAVAYYLQVFQGNDELSSQDINDELKHLGYPIANITKALTKAMDVTPRLMHQTRKEGTSQQARKKYKVTHEGMKFLQAKTLVET